MAAKKDTDDVVFVVLNQATGAVQKVFPDRKGGQEESLKDVGQWVARQLHIQKRSLTDVKADFERLTGQLRSVMATIGSGPFGDMHLDEMEVALAINGKGSIGFATAGVEASITLTFKKGQTG